MILSLLVRSSCTTRSVILLSKNPRKHLVAVPISSVAARSISTASSTTFPQQQTSKRRRSYHPTFVNYLNFQAVEQKRQQLQEQPPTAKVTTTSKTTTAAAAVTTNNSNRLQHQVIAYDFLQRVSQNQIPPEFICQKVQEILLQILFTNDSGACSIVQSDGPLALELLNTAIQHAAVNGEKILPRLFSLSIQIMVHSNHPLALNEIQYQLFRLLSIQENGSYYFTNDDITYNSHQVNDSFYQLIQYVANDYKTTKRKVPYKVSQNILKLMKRLEDLYDDPSVAISRCPNGCDAFVRYYCTIEQNPTKAYQYLKRMIEGENGDDIESLLVKPTLVSTFTNIIAAFAKIGNPTKALEIIQWMLSSYRKSNMPPPNWTCFNALLDAYARSGRHDAGSKAEQTLEWMKQLHHDQNLETEPDVISYATCINAWARSSSTNRDAPYHAESLLKQLIELHQTGKAIAPSDYAFTSVLNAWGNSNYHSNIAPMKIRELINLMNEISSSPSSPSSPGGNNNNSMLEVTAIPYSILLKALGKRAKNTNNPKDKLQCGEEALQVLEQMKDANIPALPGTYNAVITTLQRVSLTSALLYFLELEDDFRTNPSSQIILDTRTFNCGLNVIAAMNKPDASTRAFNVLERMFEYADDRNNKNVHPDETTFNIILKILSLQSSQHNDCATKANDLLQLMIDTPGIKPSYWSYIPTIMAWGRTTSPDKFTNIQDLIVSFEHQQQYSSYSGSSGGDDDGRRRQQQYQPTKILSVYNTALSVCYHNEDTSLIQDAIETANFTMERVRSIPGLYPDDVTYLNYFRAMAQIGTSNDDHDDDDANTTSIGSVNLNNIDDFIDKEFQYCISDGLVSQEIVRLICQISPRMFQKYLGHVGDNVSATTAVVEIPRSWSMNHQRRIRRQRTMS